MAIADRAVRSEAQQTRREILLTASRLFAERRLRGSVGPASGSGGRRLPEQGHLLLREKGRSVRRGCGAVDPGSRSRRRVGGAGRNVGPNVQTILAESALGPGLPAVLALVEAMLIARRRPDLAPQIKATLDRLHKEGARATSDFLARKRSRMKTGPEVAAQNFWVTMTDVALQLVASGATSIGAGLDV
jgi:TetR/AcrR family transcriptional regulator, regulator of cefoperazone and chloramphenicol sensitivity